ncbi:MAG TPA: methyltransferase domain-containing protein [Actinomycetota bacterium]|nr:methyltransferase domain-containing protein [Actinomycetota bacterium]
MLTMPTMPRVTPQNFKHLSLLLRLGKNPAATVYESLGEDFFIAPPDGWLNLGLWEPGQHDASKASEHLVATLAGPLPKHSTVVDVGNGLGAQDPVIREVTQARSLIAVNITEAQLRYGAERLQRAEAAPLAADATRLPLRDASAEGIISVEAAFHFPSRPAFFAEARRVLSVGGVLSMSDVSMERFPLWPDEALAGATNLRLWGLKASNMTSAATIEAQIRAAGFSQVEVRRCTAEVLDPAIAYLSSRLDTHRAAPLLYRAGARLMLAQWSLLRRRGVIEYLLITAS